jgi:hypothetical protein
MNSNPPNRQLPHEEAIRRFLERLSTDLQPRQDVPQPMQDQPQPKQDVPQPMQDQPESCRPTTDELVTPEAAEELTRWFQK